MVKVKEPLKTGQEVLRDAEERRELERVVAERKRLEKLQGDRDLFAKGCENISALFNDRRFSAAKAILEKECMNLIETRKQARAQCHDEFSYIALTIECDSKLEVIEGILGMKNAFNAKLAEIDKDLKKIKGEK